MEVKNKITVRDQLRELYRDCNLTKEDTHKHKHYNIITRTGIEKIQICKGIEVRFEIVKCDKEYACVKAIGRLVDQDLNEQVIETFGSAVYGGREKTSDGKFIETGNTKSWYLVEIAEKRALSRVVLKLTKGYSLGVFGEDEAEDFKKPINRNQV